MDTLELGADRIGLKISLAANGRADSIFSDPLIGQWMSYTGAMFLLASVEILEEYRRRQLLDLDVNEPVWQNTHPPAFLRLAAMDIHTRESNPPEVFMLADALRKEMKSLTQPPTNIQRFRQPLTGAFVKTRLGRKILLRRQSSSASSPKFPKTVKLGVSLAIMMLIAVTVSLCASVLTVAVLAVFSEGAAMSRLFLALLGDVLLGMIVAKVNHSPKRSFAGRAWHILSALSGIALVVGVNGWKAGLAGILILGILTWLLIRLIPASKSS